MAVLKKIPLGPLLVGSLMLGLAPFVPEPHLWSKLKMLAAGELSAPVDIFDLLMHGAFPALLMAKLVSLGIAGRANAEDKA